MLNKLQDIELKLVNHHHPMTRQQYHETKLFWKSIAEDLRQMDRTIHFPSPTCLTPLSATSSGYGSDMN